MGFADDLDAILEQTPAVKQTALFSATMPPRIKSIAHRHLKHPAEITIAKEPVKAGAAPRVQQMAYIVTRPYRGATLARIIDMAGPKSALIFCRTRLEVDEVTQTLNSRGYRAEAIHGGMSQVQRDRVMQAFRIGADGIARRHRCGCARPGHSARLACHQLRSALLCGGLCTSHRPDRPGRTGGRGDDDSRPA